MALRPNLLVTVYRNTLYVYGWRIGLDNVATSGSEDMASKLLNMCRGVDGDLHGSWVIILS